MYSSNVFDEVASTETQLGALLESTLSPLNAGINAGSGLLNGTASLGADIGSWISGTSTWRNVVAPLLIGVGLVIIGGLLMTFAFGGDIAQSVEKIANKLPAIPLE